MTQEKKEIRIAPKFPVAIVEEIDEAIAAGLAETRSGFIRDVVASHFDAQRSDPVCLECSRWNILILSHLRICRWILDVARQPGGFNYAYGLLDGTRDTIECQVRLAEAEAQRASTNAWLSKLLAASAVENSAIPPYFMGPKRMRKWRSPMFAPHRGVQEGAANGSEKGKEKTETEVKNGSTKEGN